VVFPAIVRLRTIFEIRNFTHGLALCRVQDSGVNSDHGRTQQTHSLMELSGLRFVFAGCDQVYK